MNRALGLWACSLLLAPQAFAGGTSIGNGGWGLRCGNAVYLADFKEAEAERNAVIDLGPPSDAVETKVALALQRLSERPGVKPGDIDTLARDAHLFLTSADQPTIRDGHWYADKDSYIGDPMMIGSPNVSAAVQKRWQAAGCEIVPVAMQQINPWWWGANDAPDNDGYPYCGLGRSYCYYRDESLWALADNDTKAGFALHESLWSRLQLWQKGSYPQPSDLRKLVADLCAK